MLGIWIHGWKKGKKKKKQEHLYNNDNILKYTKIHSYLLQLKSKIYQQSKTHLKQKSAEGRKYAFNNYLKAQDK